MYRSFRKYRALFALGFKNAITYRAELVLWGVLNMMPLVATLALWTSIYQGQQTIAGYSQASLVLYYLIGFICSEVTAAYFERGAIEHIHQGTMAGYLTKPFSLKISYIVQEFGWRVVGFVAALIPLIGITYAVAGHSFPHFSWQHLVFVPIFLALAYITECCFSLVIVAMGFVFEQAESLMHLKWMLTWLFSGGMMPFAFMPEWLRTAASFLPFQFRYYVPVTLFLHGFNAEEVVRLLAISIGWLIVMIVMMKWLWRRNIKAFTAVGN